MVDFAGLLAHNLADIAGTVVGARSGAYQNSPSSMLANSSTRGLVRALGQKA